jgi:hypothetical protein
VASGNIAYYWRKMAEAEKGSMAKHIPWTALPVLASALVAPPARAVTPDAEAFMAAVQKMAPVLCERRKLRREIAAARIGEDDVRERALRARLEEIARDAETTRLDRRVKALRGRLVDSSGRVREADDLRAISAQQLELYARCE